ncbi:reverse transcriptase domain-containing protein, partial [Tanacetum coccineum]
VKQKTWLDKLNEGTIEMWDELRTACISRFFPPSLFDRLLEEISAFSQHENKSLTDAWLRMKEMLQNCHGHNLFKGNTVETRSIQSKKHPRIVAVIPTQTKLWPARMDAMTIKMDAQYKELQSRAKQPTPNLNDDDMLMSHEEEAKFMQTFHSLTSNLDDLLDLFQVTLNQTHEVATLKLTNHRKLVMSSDDEDDEPTPQPKTQPTKPVKETPLPKPYKQKIPYPQRLRKEKIEAQYGKFLDMIRAFRINVPLVDVLAGMPNYGKFLKELISNKHKIEQISAAFLSDESSAMIQNKVPPKLGDPGSFLIPCNFNKTFSCNALADLGASINLMPYSLYAKLSLKTLKPTKMSVRLADRSFQYPVGIAKNMLVEVVIRVKQKQLNLGVGTERMIFNIDSAMKHSYSNDDTCFSIDVIDEILEEDFDALLDEGSKILHSIEGTLLEEEIFSEFDEFMAMTADENSESESDTEEPPFEKITINTDYKIKTSLEEPPTDLELKPLPDNLEYVFLEEPSFLPVIISSKLSAQNKSKLVSVLKKHKEAFAWKTTDIPGICPSFCKHKIQLLDDKKPVVQKQRRLNPNMQEVVKKEIVKLLDTGIIYPIADSPWVSPIHCVPKKGGITVVTNENDELVPTRTVTGWRVCIDYRKLNEATAKDHFPLPFMDQMLERLAGNKYFCFLDGFSGYFQIPIDPMDQEKTTFTCPFGTYAYRRMPFGLCNAPATFQRCMLAIFHDMIEESVKVFMDDFSVFGDSFKKCLNNLDKMLQHCKDAHLVLNWEKCHFMVKEGIVLGHNVSSAGLEIDKAKMNVISKLPLPTNIKDTPFEFNDECKKAFELLKEKLTCAPMIVSPNWNIPLELMCDASDFVVGAVLEFDIEIKDKKGTENGSADHLPRIENDESSDDSDVNDNFPGETLMKINTKDEPWFTDFANYLVADIILKGMTYQQKNKFFSDLKHYFWEEPILFKVLDSGYYWSTIIKEARTLVCLCEACQKTGNISKRDEMPLTNLQETDIREKDEKSSKNRQNRARNGKA